MSEQIVPSVTRPSSVEGALGGLTDDLRRQFLLDLAKIGDADLGHFADGLTGPVWVLDLGDDVQVGNEMDMLQAYLHTMGLSLGAVE